MEYYIKADGQLYTGDLIEGDRIATPEEIEAHFNPPLTEEEMRTRFTAAIDQYMNDFAKTREYDSMASAASYCDDEDPQFQMEGKYCKDMRSKIYRLSANIRDAVKAGKRPMPTPDEVVAELPVLVWPEQKTEDGGQRTD